MSGNTREAGRSTVDRLLTTLEVFDGRDLSLSDVVRRSGLPVTTAHRMLGALEAWGGVERTPEGRYRVGTRLWRVGTRASNPTRLRELALPMLQDLYEATHQNVQLAILDGTAALVVERLSGDRSVHSVTTVGGRLPLHATAVGKILLSGSPEAVAAITRGPLRRFTPYTLTMPGAVAAAVERAKESGLALAHEEMTLGASSLASVVPDSSGGVRAAVGVVAHSHVDLRRHERDLKAAAAAIGEALTRRLGDPVAS